ncbi:hypothetical protein MMC07_001994 [Pseudocyphellaria aurata]|nr:hypothetical protein [Pseudocyphellaria aurata]
MFNLRSESMRRIYNLRSEHTNLFARVAAVCADSDSDWVSVDSDEERLRSILYPTHEENGTSSEELFDTSPKKASAAELHRSYMKYDLVRKGGPSGSPVYDELGYQLDYHKLTGNAYSSRSSKPGKPRYKSERELDKEEHRKRKIMGTPKNNVSALTLMAWNERVSRDLMIPFHTVQMEHFEEWQERGFVAEPGEFEAVNMSEEKRNFITNLACGSAFRK